MDMSAKSGGRRARPTFTDQEALQFHQQGRPATPCGSTIVLKSE